MAQLVAKDARLHDIIGTYGVQLSPPRQSRDFLLVPLTSDGLIFFLTDAFYFEHHVFLSELAPYWRRTMGGSVQQSLELFAAMREKGIASHYWP
jgi:hypothetical protein